MGEHGHRPEEEQFIATGYIDLTRHGSRFGGPMKLMLNGEEMVFDDTTDLTPRGKEGARQFGATYPEEVTLVHPRGGREPRHLESGEDMLSGSGRFGTERTSKNLGPAFVRGSAKGLAEGRLKGARISKGTDYQSAGVMSALKKYKDIILTELNRIVSDLSPDEQERLKTDAELRARYREQAQIRGLEEGLKDQAITDVLAENEAEELMHAVEVAIRGVKGGETKAIPVVGSGLFAEALFKKALVVEDGETRKVGFDDVNEIGGFTKQATAFRIKIERDTRDGTMKLSYEFTDPKRAELFKGKQVSLDWDTVVELAAKAEARFSAETK